MFVAAGNVVDWNEANIAKLKSLWQKGLSCSQIAAEIPGSTRSAIIGKVHRLKLPPRRDSYSPSTSRPAAVPRPAKPKPSPLPRRNQTNSVIERIAIAAAEPGLPDRLKGEAPTGEGIQLRQLSDLNCHWPKGDPRNPDFEFCGARAVPGFPYCAHHYRIAYEPPKLRAHMTKWSMHGADVNA